MAEACLARNRCLARTVGLLLAPAIAGCTGSALDLPTAGPRIEIDIDGLAVLDPAAAGAWEAWSVDADGTIQAAIRFDGSARSFDFQSHSRDPAWIMITLEPPGDDDESPSSLKLLGGRFADDGTATLSTTGYLTPVGLPIEPEPGSHILGVASAGLPGSTAQDDAGLWLVDTRVDSTNASFFQTFTPLTKGWTYEGWVVRDIDSPGEVWISYGQFLPNNLRKARFRDDTGIGPFSGFVDWTRALVAEVHYPGDDWIANPGGYPVPGGLALPLDLNGDAAAGQPSRWTHVITIEPRPEADGIRTEEPWEAEPFFLRPYRNAIGEDPPQTPRTIRFIPQSLPSGTARIVTR